jgi:hypothetical protein
MMKAIEQAGTELQRRQRRQRYAHLPSLVLVALLTPLIATTPAAAEDDMPQGTAGAACSGPLWSYYVHCPSRRIAATVSGGVDATTSGEFTVERPTLTALGFDWRISGDENRNASVTIEYRKRGETAWRKGLPLHRLQGESLTTGSPPLRYVVPNMFSGSVFDLEPDTEYEVRLALADPDGVTGQTVQTATVRTRAEPKTATGGKVYHVYPFGHTGPRQEPSFMGLNAA